MLKIISAKYHIVQSSTIILNNKKYGDLAQVTKRIDYDIKHEVEKQEVLDFLELVKTDESYSELRKANDFGYRLDTLEAGFLNKDSKANHSLSFIDYSS